jgi:hypothetical protein
MKAQPKPKNLTLDDCDAERAKMLCEEIGKVRCWLTGFAAARAQPGGLNLGVPGEDSLRQMQIILKASIAKAEG